MGVQGCSDTTGEREIIERLPGGRSRLKCLPLDRLDDQITCGLQGEFMQIEDEIIEVGIAPIDVEKVLTISGSGTP